MIKHSSPERLKITAVPAGSLTFVCHSAEDHRFFNSCSAMKSQFSSKFSTIFLMSLNFKRATFHVKPLIFPIKLSLEPLVPPEVEFSLSART